MFRTKISDSARTLFLCTTIFTISAIVLWLAAGKNAASRTSTPNISPASSHRAFPGTNTGAIPDGLTGTPPQFGSPRTINFVVSGVAGPLTEVSVDMQLTHPWVGDVEMILAAPGGTPSMHIASRIGVTTAGSFGDSSNFNGVYTFSDIAQGFNIWTIATDVTCTDVCNVTPGYYRTTQPGQTGQTNPAPVTSLNTTFGGLTPAQANGTWTLTFRDAAASNTGTVVAANLTIAPIIQGAPVDSPVDFNGDFKSDYVVVRNVGGGASGQIRWFYNLNGAGGTVVLDWGLNTDSYVSEDFDNDNKDDIGVWRPGAAGVAAFYVLRSGDNTALVDVFGQTDDDPSVVDDYNGDGFADFAVYRSGTTAGAQSTWFFRTSPGGAVTYVPWGQNGDFPMPGDIDGNGSADFTVQRNNGMGQGAFWTMLSTGAVPPVVTFGSATDQMVPGDYDADGKTDIAIVRGMSGSINWWWLRSWDGTIVGPVVFGISATDFPTPGDYDGDGKVEPAIYRPGNPNGVFWSKNSSNGLAAAFTLGSTGDYPVANFNVH